MQKRKILLFGDFRESFDSDLAASVPELAGDDFDIAISGIKTDRIRELDKDPGVYICTSVSQDFIYHQNTAEAAVVLSPAFRYRKTRKDQTLIYCINEFDEDTFAGIISDIDIVITGSKAVAGIFRQRFPFIKTILTKENISETVIKEILSRVNVPAFTGKRQLMVVSFNSYFDFEKDKSGLSALLRDSGNMGITPILFGHGVNADIFRTRIIPNKTKRTRAFLSGFEGDVLFCSDRCRKLFYDYIRANGFSFRCGNEYRIEDSIFLIGGYDPGEMPSEGRYSSYTDLLENVYETLGCRGIKISIVICRYNTSQEMVERAVGSAFDAGHDNIEVVLIDDGSAERLRTDHGILSDDRVRYLYNEANKGVGAARNEGMDLSTGEYIVFLDSDDMMYRGGLRLLLAHIVLFDIDMVKGSRIIANKEGKPLSIAFKNLSGDLFRIYYPDVESDIYSDVMMTNAVIRRSALTENDIRCADGIFEDVDFITTAYSSFPEYHYVNIPFYIWFKYGSDSSVSSYADRNSLLERIGHSADAWDATPDVSKRSRMRTLLTYDFRYFYSNWFRMSERDRIDSWNDLRDFFITKAEWFDEDSYNETQAGLVKAFSAGSFEYFEYLMRRYFYISRSDIPHDIYVVHNKRQLDDACRRTRKNKAPARLYLSKNGGSFDQKLIYDLKSSKMFDEVTPFDDREVKGVVLKEIKKRPDLAELVINDYHFAKYGGIFKNCDTDIDTLYIYDYYGLYHYYTETFFRNIKKIDPVASSGRENSSSLKRFIRKIIKRPRRS